VSASTAYVRALLLLPVAAAGIVTLLASSTFEEDTSGDQATTVDWVVSSLAAPLVRDRGDRTATITNIRLAGSFDATAGDDLSLDRDRTPIDSTSGFDMELVADNPDDDDALSGTLEMNVLAALDFGLDEDPTTGQFSILADGTTTLVTVQADPQRAIIETGGGSSRTMEWGDFRDAADDQDAGHDLRLASEAYNTISDLIKLARFGEDLIGATEDNRDELENMGLDDPLSLTCDNRAGDASGDAVLLWRVDAAGSDEGDLGNGDSIEARYENCRNDGLDRFLDGTIVIDEYRPPRGDPPRTLGGEFDFSTLFVAEDQVTIETVPEAASPRVDGGLQLLYEETLVNTTP
jgi:hypothetical protein